MKGRLEEIGRSIDIRMRMPAATTGIGSAGFPIRLRNCATDMAGLRRIRLTEMNNLDALPFRLVGDQVGEFGKRLGMQTLVEPFSVINLLANASQRANGNGIHTRLTAPIHEVFREDMQQMINLPRLFAFDLTVPA